MPDPYIESVHELLTAIADGTSWDHLRAVFPHVTEQRIHELERFVWKCQERDRNAWKTWSDEDIRLLDRFDLQGVSIVEIGQRLGRSEAAIKIMLAGRASPARLHADKSGNAGRRRT